MVMKLDDMNNMKKTQFIYPSLIFLISIVLLIDATIYICLNSCNNLDRLVASIYIIDVIGVLAFDQIIYYKFRPNFKKILFIELGIISLGVIIHIFTVGLFERPTIAISIIGSTAIISIIFYLAVKALKFAIQKITLKSNYLEGTPNIDETERAQTFNE